MSTLGALHRYGGRRDGPSHLLSRTAWNCESSRCHQMAAHKTLSTSRCSQMAAHNHLVQCVLNLSKAYLFKDCLYNVWAWYKPLVIKMSVFIDREQIIFK